MAKPKLKVNAKSFVRDYRAGKSDSELMDSYNLSSDGLNKLLKMLVDKRMLFPSELKSDKTFPSTELLDAPPFDEPTPRPRPKRVYEPRRDLVIEIPSKPDEACPETSRAVDSSRCPQCGAQVTEKMLICPECGHVLPGEERWANVEPKPRLMDRIPPKVLGTLVALPAAIVLFFVFRDIILPMTESTIEKRSTAVRTARSTRSNDARLKGRSSQVNPAEALDRLVEELIGSNVFANANEELTVFHAGPGWWRMSGDERLETLDRLRKAMRKSVGEFELEVLDSSGAAVAWVNHDSVELLAQ